jgi:hypothetical protein
VLNFPGKFESIVSGPHSHSFVDVETVKHQIIDGGPGSITIADAQLLYNGDYKRSGVDLILSKDGHQLVVPDYFRGEHRASLATPDGSHLTGNIVSALAGSVEYAQASNITDTGKVIGHVTKLTGTATAIRNGVSIILNSGDNVEKGDVVQAGSDSQLGITFVDGTVFGLASNARMVLNEMVYDPNGSSNSSLLTLVAGTISFVAGETAKHGDMKVDTPTAIVGIRGTAVLVEIDFTVPASGNTPAVNFQVLAEPDGHTGSYILYTKPTATNPIPVEIGRVDQSGQSYTITANNQLASTAAPALSPQAAAIVLETFVAKFNAPPPQVTAPASPDKTAPNNANPNSTGGGGSSTPPPPATPLDTSPIDNHNTQPTDQTPTPTPISTTPTPNNVVTPPITTAITTAAAAGGAIATTITVTPVADTPNFTIPHQVTTPSTPPPTFVAFVPGSGTVPSVTTNGTPPPGVDLTKIITVNEITGAVSYNPADFAFLKPGQSAIATIAFLSNDGTENVPETLTLTIDGQTPQPPVVTVSNPSVVITSSATQTISGTVAAGLAAPGATVTLLDTVNGVAQQIGTATVASDGTWTTQVTLQGDGTHSIVAQDTDAVGNVGSSAPVVVTLDTIPPTVTINTAGNISNVATHTISGTVIAGDAAIGTTVELLDTVLDPATQHNVTRLIGTATVGAGGAWSTSVTLAGDGDHTIVATDIDAAGGVGASSPVVFTLSTTLPPTVTIATAPETSNAATQTISGHVSQGESPIGTTVALYDTFNAVTTQIGTATVDGNGGWTTQVTLSGDGAHSITVQDIDVAGNLGASDPVVFTLDTLPPTVLVNTAGITTNHPLQAISGSVAAGEAAVGSTVTLLDNGDVIGTATVGNGGLWTTNVTLSGDGTHNVVAQDIDAAGNLGNSAPVTFTLDTLAPSVAISTASSTTNQSHQTISGSVTTTEAAAGSTVTLFDNGNAIGTANVGSGGLWTTSVTLSGDGVHNVTAQDTDAVGNVGTSTPVVFTLDTLPPTVKISTSGTTTNQALQTISGTVSTTEATAGTTVTLFDTFNGVTTQIGTATLSGGNWSTGVTLSGNGTHSIVAVDTDAAANIGSSGPTVFTLATVAPAIAITTPIAGDNTIDKAEASAGVTISGFAVPGVGGAAVNGQTATITIVDSSNVVVDIFTATVTAGAWSVNLTAGQAQALADGSYTIKATVTDAAGNTATTATQAITVDETAPSGGTPDLVAASDSGTANTDNITDVIAPSFTVALNSTVAVGDTVHLLLVGSALAHPVTQTVTAGDIGAGSVTLTVTAGDLGADGTKSISAQLSDAAGNTSTTSALNITLDTTAPTGGTPDLLAASDSGTSSTDDITKVTAPSFTVALGSTVAVGDTVQLLLGGLPLGHPVTHTVTASDITTGSVTLTVTAGDLGADGIKSFSAQFSDAAGNTSATTALNITLDTTAPAGGTPDLVAASDSGVSNTDNLTDLTAPSFTMTLGPTATAGDTVQLLLGGAALAHPVIHTITATDVTTGSVTLTVAAGDLGADGAKSISAQFSDAAGNTSTTSALGITLDTTAPTGGTPDLVAASDSGTSSTDNITDVTAPSFTVALNPTVVVGDTVQLLLGGAALAHPVTHTITAADVTAQSITLAVTAGDLGVDGIKSITAQFGDAAGNISTTSALNVTLDTTPPLVTISGSGGSTNQATQTISGTVDVADIGTTVTLFDNGSTTPLGTTTVGAGGAWSTSVTLVGNTTHSIVAQDTDAAGNTGSSSAIVFTLNTTAPSGGTPDLVPASDSGTSNTDNITNVTAPTFTIALNSTAVAGDTIQLLLGGSPLAHPVIHTITAADVTAGSVSLLVTAGDLGADGTKLIAAQFSDSFGNTTTTSPLTLTLDTAAPTGGAPDLIAASDSGTSSIDNITDVTAPSFTVALNSTVAVGDTVQLLLGGAALAHPVTHTVTATDVSAGSVTLTATAGDLGADGTKSITAQFSDTAGNTSATSALSITLDTTAPTGGTPDLVAASDSGTSSTDNITDVTAPSFTVALNPTVVIGDTVQLLLGGAALAHPVTHTVTATDISIGTVTLTVTAGDLGADGTKLISAQFSDAAGNTSTTSALSITLDTTAPTGGTPDLVAASDSGTSSTDNITNVTAPIFAVALNPTVVAGDTVQLLLGGAALAHPVTHTVTGTDIGAGSVTLAVTVGDLGADGAKSITAQFNDAAGNNSTTSALSITLDTTAPTGGTPDLVAASDSGASSTDNITNVTAPSFTVALGSTVAVGDTVQFLLNGAALAHPVTHTITAADFSTGSVTLTVTSGDLGADGSKSISAQFTDTADNGSTTSALSITLDTTAPSGGTPDLVAASDSGTSSTDNITNVTAPSFTVALGSTLAVGDTVQLLLNGSPLTHPVTHAVTASDISTGSVTLTVTSGDLGADGTKSISAKFTDTAGNTSTTAALNLTLDTTAPTGGTPDLTAASDSGTSSTDNITNVTAPSFTIALNPTVAAGDVVQLLLAGAALVAHTITAAEASAGSVTLTAPAGSLSADGIKSISAQFSDAAGNTSTTSALIITLDTVAPHVTINGTGGSTTQSTQTISGTVTTTEATAGGSVLLFDTYNGVQTQIGTATLSGGAWSTTLTLVGNGTHSIVAEDVDIAGNAGTSTAISYSLTVAVNSWANPSGGSWTVGSNWSSGSVPANTANDTIGIIGATAPYSVTVSSGTTVLANSLLLDDPFATLDDQGTLAIAASLTLTSGTIDIEGTLSVAGSLGLGAGTIDIQNGGTLSIGSAANPFAVNFAGTGGNLVLGNGGSYTGTVSALSIATETVGVAGSGNLNSLVGDALDLTASGGTQTNPSNLVVGLTGTITGAATGINVIQNAVGNITVTTSGSVTGQTQRGILAEESATGVGSALVTGSANVTGGGSTFSGIVAENLNTANANTVTVSQTGNVTGGFDGIKALTDGAGNVSVTTGSGATITGTNDYGIEAFSNSTGSVSVTTAANSPTIPDIVSGSAGINVYNQATAIPQSGGTTTSTITVTAAGTIDSGFILTGSSARPAGILAGYKGGTTAIPNSAVYGNVIVNNSANINSGGGDGIRAYNYGNGNVTINDLANTTIIAADEFGIQGASYGSGNVTVSSVASDVIDSGSSGLSGVNLATSIAAGLSTVSVTARGAINSGFNLTPSGSQPQGVSSGYFPGNAGSSNTNVNGTVILDNFANVTAAAGWGLDAYNYGNGSAILTDEANTTVSGAQFGIGAYSNSSGTGSSGSVTVNVGNNATISSGSLYGLVGIQANANNAGNISVTTTTGDIVNSGGIGIQANNQASKATSASQISITTVGTINSGYDINQGGGQPGGIWAGYNPSNAGTVNSNVVGAVIVDNSAVINAPAGAGIGLYNYGIGTVSVTLETTSAITSELWGVNAATQGGGNLTVINKGSIIDSNGVGILANIGTNVANSVNGVVSVNNSGTITALGSSSAPVIQINNSSTQAALVTNSGIITADLLGKDTNSQAIAVYNGTVTITNTGTISGNVSLNGGTFNNNAGGIWNISGSDYFGNAASSIVNAGIINILGLTFLNAGSTFTFANSNAVNVAANGDAFIAAAISGTGTFTIGDRAELEFFNSVAGQTVSFTGTDGLLILDSPAAFTSGSITGIAAGDAIELNGIGIASATINGSTLTITETNAQTLSYQVSLNSATTTFDILHGNEILFVPLSTSNPVIPVTGSLGAQSFTTSVAQFYQVKSATINASAANGLNITSSDNVAGHALTVEIDQASSISMSGAFNAVNLSTTAGDNIELINAGSVNSQSGGAGIVTNSGTGSTDILDSGGVSATKNAISAQTTGPGTLNIAVNNGANISSANGSGISAIATGAGNIDVSTSQGATVTSGTSGIFAENQGTAVGSANSPSSILVTTSGTINSGSNPGSGEPAGILAFFLGGGTAPGSPPNAAVFGNIIVNNDANITANTGMGINASNYGIGDITVVDESGTTITATAAGATVAGFTQYGIGAFNYGSGKTTVTTDFGSTINSGGAGIDAVNQATAIAAAAGSTITVIASGAINSGANLNNSGSAPAGILAGYNPGNAGTLNPSVTGNVLVEYDGTVQNGVGGLVAGAGDGISAFNYGIGNVEVDLGFSASITALNPASAGSTAPYGISASNRGTGNVIVNMSNGDVVHSGSIGINAVNQDTSILATANSIIEVYAAGTITSGTIPTNTGAQASGISAGYLGANAGANISINGNVIVANTATINASAGSAINAYNYGNGNVTVNDAAGTIISGAQYGISAYTESGGTGNLSINVGANASITATNPVAASTSTLDYGIHAFSSDAGSISIITSNGDTITANGTGINAVNEASTIAQSVGSSIVITTGTGTINSGTEETGTGSPPGGIVAGYLLGNLIPTTYPQTTLFGDVEVNNSSNINAASGDGIRAYDYGIGDVEVNDFAGSIILQGEVATGNSGLQNGYGSGIAASNGGSGNIYVMTAAGTSIDASLAGSGIAAINKAPAPTGSTFTVPATSYVEVLAYGTIKSGTDLTGSGDIAAGILAGYNPANADLADGNVHGTVHIDDYASITASGDGIRGINYGDGTITIIAEAGAVISAQEYGIAAIGGDGGAISITTSATLTGVNAAIETTTSATAESVTIENLGHMTGLVITQDAAFDNGAGAEWDLAGASTFTGGTNTITNAGVIDSTGTASITAPSGTLSITNTGTVNVQSGSLDIGGPVTGTGQFTIASGGQLELTGAVSSGQTVTFEGSTGTLKLDDPVDFHGQISGLTGSDGINLQGFDSTTVVSPVIGTTQTTLTVTDDHHSGPLNDVVITLLGNYTGSSFNFSNVQGGVLIADPPAAAPVVATTTATGANQTLTGTGIPDNFVFNFANVGQATVTNFDADTDVLEVKASLFTNLQAILDATHDDTNGNAVVALDSHDSITLTGVTKAQLHPTDFHLV